MLKLKLPSWMCVPEVVQAGVKETIRSRRGAPNGGTPLARYPQRRRQTQYCTEILQLFVNNNKEACRLSHPAHWGWCEGGTQYCYHDAATRAPKTSFGPNQGLLTSWRLFAVAFRGVRDEGMGHQTVWSSCCARTTRCLFDCQGE